ncbi:MAG: 16S rRNA (cytosine(967)-C(5))-methyltransferase RsmB [Pseudomonadales bacterium]
MQNVRALAAIAVARVMRDGKPFDGEVDMLAGATTAAALHTKAQATEAQAKPAYARTHMSAQPSSEPKAHHQQHAPMPNDPRDRALYRELCYGTLRQYFYLQALLAPRLKKPLGKRDTELQALLLIGLYQLVYMRVPDHAALSATVDACTALEKKWARGLVNAVLRNVLRDWERSGRDALPPLPTPSRSQKDAGNAARDAHPEWLYRQLQKDWPAHWQEIVACNNAGPHMTLRVDLSNQSREQYALQLRDAGLVCEPSALVDTALLLERAVDPTALPGFQDGAASVQDAGAQLAATLLSLAPGQRVLDACAAPGGKALHILQQVEGIALTALDIDAGRLQRVRDNLARGVAASAKTEFNLCIADAADTASWWNGECFDRILLDAPCSGSGVIARHPDIKLLRRQSDIGKLAAAQFNLLAALWPTLAEGGELLYCSCSVLRAENESVVAKFLCDEASAELLPLPENWGLECATGRQLLPKKGLNDGFFYARLRKQHTEQ